VKGFYYDIMPDANGDYYRDTNTATQASFWAYFAGAASTDQCNRFVKDWLTPARFGGDFPGASLASENAEFHREGGYWRGGRWVPSAMALAIGMAECGRLDVAHAVSRNFLSSMAKVSQSDVFEFYGMMLTAAGAEKPIVGQQQGHSTRGEFAGMSNTMPLYGFERFVAGLNFRPGYVGSDAPNWLQHEHAPAAIASKPDQQRAFADGYIEWNLFYDMNVGESIKASNFIYRGQMVRNLEVQKLGENHYAILVDSDKPITVQVNRLFKASGGREPQPQASYSTALLSVGGSAASRSEISLEPVSKMETLSSIK
jgi:hypothetical protein